MKATDEMKHYLNSIINKIDDDIHNELWNKLIDIISENEQLKDALLPSCGCPQCASKNIKEECNNHHQTNDEMEYLEYMKCLNCGHGFIL